MVVLSVSESRTHAMVPAPKTGMHKLQLIIPLSCHYQLVASEESWQKWVIRRIPEKLIAFADELSWGVWWLGQCRWRQSSLHEERFAQPTGVRRCSTSPKCVWLLAAFLDLVLFTLVLNAEVLIFYVYVNIVHSTHSREARWVQSKNALQRELLFQNLYGKESLVDAVLKLVLAKLDFVLESSQTFV